MQFSGHGLSHKKNAAEDCAGKTSSQQQGHVQTLRWRIESEWTITEHHQKLCLCLLCARQIFVFFLFCVRLPCWTFDRTCPRVSALFTCSLWIHGHQDTVFLPVFTNCEPFLLRPCHGPMSPLNLQRLYWYWFSHLTHSRTPNKHIFQNVEVVFSALSLISHTLLLRSEAGVLKFC